MGSSTLAGTVYKEAEQARENQFIREHESEIARLKKVGLLTLLTFTL